MEKSEITVTVTLTRSEWCEVVNALTSKAASIRSGAFRDPRVSRAEDDVWADELDSANHKLATVLDEAGVTY